MPTLKSLSKAFLITVTAAACSDVMLDQSFSQETSFRRAADGNTMRAESDSLIWQSEQSPDHRVALDTTFVLTQQFRGATPGPGMRGGVMINGEQFATPNHRQWRSGYATLESVRAGRPLVADGLRCEEPRFRIVAQMTTAAPSFEEIVAEDNQRAIFRDPANTDGALGTSRIANARASRITAYLYCGDHTFTADVAGSIE